MNKLIYFLIMMVTGLSMSYGQVEISNDTTFNTTVNNPIYNYKEGPKILVDGGHHNFFVQENFIKTFTALATSDGYNVIIDSLLFTEEYLNQFDIIVITTALKSNYTGILDSEDLNAFNACEINSLYNWVCEGGSLLVFSDHPPFDQAISSVLQKFGIAASIGLTIDTVNFDKERQSKSWIVFSRQNGGLNLQHPIIKGRNKQEQINQIVTFSGSGLTGAKYSNIFKLSQHSQNVGHLSVVDPKGKGNSQCLGGKVGKGKIIAFGDATGFTALLCNDKKSNFSAGMNYKTYDWKQLILNTLHWLSNEK